MFNPWRRKVEHGIEITNQEFDFQPMERRNASEVCRLVNLFWAFLFCHRGPAGMQRDSLIFKKGL